MSYVFFWKINNQSKCHYLLFHTNEECLARLHQLFLLLLPARPGQILGRTRPAVILNWIVQMQFIFFGS
jgi:hypothetical protein